MGHRLITRLSLVVLLLGLGGTEADAQVTSATELEPVSRFETVDGLRLHYLEWGNESAQPLLLLHGNGLNAHFWNTFAPAMAPFFRVIALDVEGYGDSDTPKDGVYDAARIDARLESLTRQRGLERLILVGHSMGGRIALSYAALHPEDVERLVLVDIGPFEGVIRPPQRDPSRQNAPAPQVTIYDTKEEAFESYREDVMNRRPLDFLGSMVGPEREAVEERFRQMVYHTLWPTADGRWTRQPLNGPRITATRFFDGDEQWAHWRSIRCPILVIRGEHSQGFSAERAERTLRDNANARLVTIGDSGHMLSLSHPAEFEAVVREWLAIQ